MSSLSAEKYAEYKNISKNIEMFPLETINEELIKNTGKVILAYKYYGMGYYHSIVYFVNDMFNPDDHLYAYIEMGGSEGFSRDQNYQKYEKLTTNDCELKTFQAVVDFINSK